jgi:hypothetical protein
VANGIRNMPDLIELRVSLSKEPQPIPYSGAPGGDVHHYASLLTEPGAIDELPELKGEPAMKHLIKSMHTSGSMFETARMAHWFSEEDVNPVSRILCLGFFFRDRILFQRFDNCMMLAGNLLLSASKDKIVSDAPFLLEIQPAILRTENLTGWIMDLYVAGSGEDQGAARSRLDQNLSQMISFFQTGGTPSASMPDES